MEPDTTAAGRPFQERPVRRDAVKAQLQAAVARRRARPVFAGLLRRCYFYAVLPQSRRSTPGSRRGSVLGRLFRLAVRGLLVFRGLRRQPGELGPGGMAA